MLDLSKPVQTRDGHRVDLLDRRVKGRYPLIGIVQKEGREVIETWTTEGRYQYAGLHSNLDLINTPEQPRLRPLNFDEIFELRDRWFVVELSDGKLEYVRVGLFYDSKIYVGSICGGLTADGFCRKYKLLSHDGKSHTKLEVEV